MGNLRLRLAWLLPWITRYFIISKKPVDRIELGVATLIRKKWNLYSYLYQEGNLDQPCEKVPETKFFWGPWIGVNMRRGAPCVREIDELDAFVMIRRAAK